MNAELAGALGRSELFRTLTPEELGALTPLFDILTLPLRAVVLSENVEGMGLYLVLSGSVQVVRVLPDQTEQQLAILTLGECFGEMSLFDEAPHSAMVRTLEPSQVARLSKARFDELIRAHSDIAVKMTTQLLRIMALRLRQSNEQTLNMLAWSLNASQMK